MYRFNVPFDTYDICGRQEPTARAWREIQDNFAWLSNRRVSFYLFKSQSRIVIITDYAGELELSITNRAGFCWRGDHDNEWDDVNSLVSYSNETGKTCDENLKS